MEENFLADKPIINEKDDQFQRYNFSKRIAETIINRTSSDSIVLGLYGAWGEGKTTVLNFIKHELEPHSSDIVHFTFNPWRFTDETTLLSSFFNTLAGEIQKNLKENETEDGDDRSFLQKNSKKLSDIWKSNKKPLQTHSEKVGESIKKYGESISMITGYDAISAIGKAISTVDVETYKKRVEKLLEENKKRIVIFIDDIDRLEKNEIHAIFRLVKLTGDFAYTTYLLSFDENMVASAIGERFGTGDQKAGLSFLEKIVQIPIKLPLAQSVALTKFCFQIVEKALESSDIILNEDEEREFSRKFTSNFVIRLTTPRLAVRYGNTLSFSLPLLKGEVNYVDLLLIEAVRVFYPELYTFIRDQPNYFGRSYGQVVSTKINDKFIPVFDQYTEKYSVDEKDNAKEALIDLFPSTKKHWSINKIMDSERTFERRAMERRISSSQYFSRYFSYTVIEGDISDLVLDELFDDLSEENYKEKIDPFKKIINSTTSENLIQKIRLREKSFNHETSVTILKVVCLLSDVFQKSATGPFGVRLTSFSQATDFVVQVVRNRDDEQDKYVIMEWIIENVESFEFSYSIFNDFRADKNGENQLFNDDHFKRFAEQFINLAKTLSQDKPIWESFTYESRYMFNDWADRIDKNSLNEYVAQELIKNPASVSSLLKVFTSFIYSSASPKPYFNDFDNASYVWLKRILDRKIIYEKVEEILGVSGETITTYDALEHTQTDENRMKQFAYWYNQDMDRSLLLLSTLRK